MKINLELTKTESLMLLNALTQYVLNPNNEKDKIFAERIRNDIRESVIDAFREED